MATVNQNTGWVKLHRSIVDWEWWSDHNTTRLFMYLIIRVNYEEKRWQGVVVMPGEIVTSLSRLSFETGLSVQSIRTSLNRLISTGELTSKSHSKYRVITINNFEKYQEVTSNITSSQQAANKQLTTTKEYKKEKNIRIDSLDAIASRKHIFLEELNQFSFKYPKDMISKFSDYWTEMNRTKTKMKFELEKTFEISKRLNTWASREKPINGSEIKPETKMISRNPILA